METFRVGFGVGGEGDGIAVHKLWMVMIKMLSLPVSSLSPLSLFVNVLDSKASQSPISPLYLG